MRKRGGDRGCWLMRVIKYPARDASEHLVRDASWWYSRDRMLGPVGTRRANGWGLVVRGEESLVPVVVDIGTDVEIIAYAFIDNGTIRICRDCYFSEGSSLSDADASTCTGYTLGDRDRLDYTRVSLESTLGNFTFYLSIHTL